MGFLSDLIRAPIGQAPSRSRGMGGLEPRRKGGLAGLLIGAKDRAPMPPRRKGGLAGLIQRVKGGLPERPMPIGGVGGSVGITKSPLQQAFEKIQNQIQPVPILPNQQGMRFDPITRKMVPAEGPDMSGKIPVPSIPSVTPPPVDRPILERPIIPPRRDDFMSIERIGDLPPSLRIKEQPDVGGPALIPGGPISIRPREELVDMGVFAPGGPGMSMDEMSGVGLGLNTDLTKLGEPRPIPPQDFGFGPGIMPPTPDFLPLAPLLPNLGGTPIANDGTLDDFVPPPGFKEPVDSNDSERFNPIPGRTPIRQDLLPPKRDDFMSIGGPGGGVLDPRTNMNIQTRDTDFGPVTISSPGFSGSRSFAKESFARGQALPDTGMDFVPAGQEEFGGDYFDRIGIPDPRTRISNYDTDRQFGAVPVNADPGDYMPRDPGAGMIATPAPTPPVQPAPTEPAAVAPTAGADPSQTQMPMGAIDPVLLQQQTSETLTDPLLRSLYFGTQDSPGFYQQLQQAGANLIGSDVPLQQTAGLSPLELLARQQAVAGLGGFEPFLQQNRDLVDQAIAQSRRAEELQDPYYTQAEEIYKDTMGAYDPSMTQQFYNPYEDAVVQKTIQDVMEAGDKQDIASRAREISAGAFGGSRARLGAEERRESLGEGLAQALGNIRSQGFQSAQATGLGEFARQQAAKRTGAQGLMGIGVGRGSAASQLGSQLAGYGSQIGGIGQTQEQMRAGQRGELSGYGSVGRGIAETGLGRIFEQQVGQQYRPMQTLGQIGSMLPGYQASQTQIDSGYGMPTDPTAAGLGAAFSAYGALAPRQEGQG